MCELPAGAGENEAAAPTLVLEDGKRLWHHTLVTANMTVEMMCVYTLLRTPGGDPAALRQVAVELLKVAQTCEENNAIYVPRSAYPLVSIMLFTSKGEVSVTVDDRHRWVDIPLPEGVVEDEVDVYSCFLQANGRPPYGCGPSLLVAAKQKHVPAEVIASVNQAPVDTDSVETTPATPSGSGGPSGCPGGHDPGRSGGPGSCSRRTRPRLPAALSRRLHRRGGAVARPLRRTPAVAPADRPRPFRGEPVGPAAVRWTRPRPRPTLPRRRPSFRRLLRRTRRPPRWTRPRRTRAPLLRQIRRFPQPRWIRPRLLRRRIKEHEVAQDERKPIERDAKRTW